MSPPNALDWVQQHPTWLGLTLILMLLVGLRSPSSRLHLRISLLLMLLLLVAGLAVRNQWSPLAGSLSLPLQQGLLNLAAGLLIIRIWGLIAFKLLLPLLHLRPPLIIADITVSLAYLVWGAICLHLAGMTLGDIVTTSAVLTAVIAFALQDTLGNLLAGIAIQLDDSIHVGDWIEHEGISGRVSEINWRATSIETRNWETAVIPNSLLLKNRFMVLGKRYHQPVQWRRWVWFDLSLETLPSQIISLVEKALQETRLPHVASTPAPNCLLMKVENGLARYAVRYWLTDLQMDDPTDSAVRTLIDAALRRHDRRIAPPIVNVLMTKEKDAVQVRHKRHTEERVAHLRRLSLFQMLSDEELLDLADHLKFTPFVAGDIMLEQGTVSDWLFIIAAGAADMTLQQGDQAPVLLGTLSSGSFFGEMGLLTGEASAYAVRAASNVECYRVGEDTFQRLFLQRSELIAALSDVLQSRLKEQQLLLENLHLHRPPPAEGVLLSKLRRFFDLE